MAKTMDPAQTATSIPPPYRSAGVYATGWPVDHGDTARQKYVLGLGLPMDFDAARLQRIENPELPYPQWLYTREPDELYVYGFASKWRDRPYFARVNAHTLDIRQKRVLPRILYSGGALIHANGDVYLTHGDELVRFSNGDLDNAQKIRLPPVNGRLTQSNGMLVAADGRLIVKSWALTRRDLGLVGPWVIAPLLVDLVLAVLLTWIGLLLLPGFTVLVALASIAVAIALPFACAATLGISLWRFLVPDASSHIMVIDPQTLNIEQIEIPPERVQYARMALYPAKIGGEWLVIPGEQFIHRWHYAEGRLQFTPEWSERYRRHGDGSFFATGPCIYDSTVYYSDNIFQIGLKRGFRLYCKPLEGLGSQHCVDMSPDTPGYMVWSSAISPGAGAVMTWDTANARVEARSLQDLSLLWQAKLVHTDCLTLVADRHQLYAVDHSQNLSLSDMMKSNGHRPAWPHIEKFFVVLDTLSGEERLRVSLGKGSPVASMIIPGMNNDVFCATRAGLNRIFQPTAQRLAASG